MELTQLDDFEPLRKEYSESDSHALLRHVSENNQLVTTSKIQLIY